MKSNFILTQDTVQLFIQRLKKIVAITGAAISNSEYTGAQKIDGYLKSVGINHWKINPVVKMSNTHFLSSVVTYRPENDQQILYIHVNSDCCYDIPYGTKMFITNTSIRYKDANKWGTYCSPKNPRGYEVVIRSYGNVKHSHNETQYTEACAKQYWDDVEANWDNEL